MAIDPLAAVYQGREGTGAAQIFKWDTAQAFDRLGQDLIQAKQTDLKGQEWLMQRKKHDLDTYDSIRNKGIKANWDIDVLNTFKPKMDELRTQMANDFTSGKWSDTKAREYEAKVQSLQEDANISNARYTEWQRDKNIIDSDAGKKFDTQKSLFNLLAQSDPKKAIDNAKKPTATTWEKDQAKEIEKDLKEANGDIFTYRARYADKYRLMPKESMYNMFDDAGKNLKVGSTLKGTSYIDSDGNVRHFTSESNYENVKAWVTDRLRMPEVKRNMMDLYDNDRINNDDKRTFEQWIDDNYTSKLAKEREDATLRQKAGFNYSYKKGSGYKSKKYGFSDPALQGKGSMIGIDKDIPTITITGFDKAQPFTANGYYSSLSATTAKIPLKGSFDMIPFAIQYNSKTGKWYVVGKSTVTEYGQTDDKTKKLPETLYVELDEIKSQLLAKADNFLSENLDELLDKGTKLTSGAKQEGNIKSSTVSGILSKKNK